MRKILTLVLALAALPAFAQTYVQKELELQAIPEQRLIVWSASSYHSPAVRLGNTIYVGYVEELNSPGYEQCLIFFLLDSEDEVPAQAETFMGVVVGSGNVRGYLWRSAFLTPTECSGGQVASEDRGKP